MRPEYFEHLIRSRIIIGNYPAIHHAGHFISLEDRRERKLHESLDWTRDPTQQRKLVLHRLIWTTE